MHLHIFCVHYMDEIYTNMLWYVLENYSTTLYKYLTILQRELPAKMLQLALLSIIFERNCCCHIV